MSESQPLPSPATDSSPPADWKAQLNAILALQEQDWNRGVRTSVEVLAQGFHGSCDPHELWLELIHNEIVLREQAGEQPTLEEYQLRFPELREPLRIQWEMDCLLVSDDGSTAGPGWECDAGLPHRYELQEELGRGAIGVVYRAWDTQLKRVVAIKRLRSGLDAAAAMWPVFARKPSRWRRCSIRILCSCLTLPNWMACHAWPWNTDGRRLVVVNAHGDATHWYDFDPETPRAGLVRTDRRSKESAGGGPCVRFNCQGDRLLMMGWSKQLAILDGDTGELIFASQPLNGLFHAADFHLDPDGCTGGMYASPDQPRRFGVMSLAEGHEFHPLVAADETSVGQATFDPPRRIDRREKPHAPVTPEDITDARESPILSRQNFDKETAFVSCIPGSWILESRGSGIRQVGLISFRRAQKRAIIKETEPTCRSG